MRKGFSLITAIIIMILLATLLTLSISLSSQSVKQTTDIFLKAQAELLARSATEYALLAISGHDRDGSGNCLEDLTIGYNNTHTATISIMYIGNTLPCSSGRILDNSITTNESNVTVIIDTIVENK